VDTINLRGGGTGYIVYGPDGANMLGTGSEQGGRRYAATAEEAAERARQIVAQTAAPPAPPDTGTPPAPPAAPPAPPEAPAPARPKMTEEERKQKLAAFLAQPAVNAARQAPAPPPPPAEPAGGTLPPSEHSARLPQGYSVSTIGMDGGRTGYLIHDADGNVVLSTNAQNMPQIAESEEEAVDLALKQLGAKKKEAKAPKTAVRKSLAEALAKALGLAGSTAPDDAAEAPPAPETRLGPARPTFASFARACEDQRVSRREAWTTSPATPMRVHARYSGHATNLDLHDAAGQHQHTHRIVSGSFADGLLCARVMLAHAAGVAAPTYADMGVVASNRSRRPVDPASLSLVKARRPEVGYDARDLPQPDDGRPKAHAATVAAHPEIGVHRGDLERWGRRDLKGTGWEQDAEGMPDWDPDTAPVDAVTPAAVYRHPGSHEQLRVHLHGRRTGKGPTEGSRVTRHAFRLDLHDAAGRRLASYEHPGEEADQDTIKQARVPALLAWWEHHGRRTQHARREDRARPFDPDQPLGPGDLAALERWLQRHYPGLARKGTQAGAHRGRSPIEHTLEAVRNCDRAREGYHPHADLRDPADRRLLRVAAALHDLGKAHPHADHPDLKGAHDPSHPERSAELARPHLWRWGLSPEEVRRADALIAHHKLLGAAQQGEFGGLKDAVERLARATGDERAAELLYHLARADADATPGLAEEGASTQKSTATGVDPRDLVDRVKARVRSLRSQGWTHPQDALPLPAHDGERTTAHHHGPATAGNGERVLRPHAGHWRDGDDPERGRPHPFDPHHAAPAPEVYAEARRTPHLSHAAAFGMAYHGPTGRVAHVWTGTSGERLPGVFRAGLKPGDSLLPVPLEAVPASEGVPSGAGDHHVRAEAHLGRTADYRTFLRDEYPHWERVVAGAGWHLPAPTEEHLARAALDLGYHALTYDHHGRPGYLILDPGRLRLLTATDAAGRGVEVPVRDPAGRERPHRLPTPGATED
jgi:HD domain